MPNFSDLKDFRGIGQFHMSRQIAMDGVYYNEGILAFYLFLHLRLTVIYFLLKNLAHKSITKYFVLVISMRKTDSCDSRCSRSFISEVTKLQRNRQRQRRSNIFEKIGYSNLGK